MGIRHFRDIVAYQRARALNRMVRPFSRTLAKQEQFELAAQLRRAAASVPLNIAEGFGVGTTQGTLRHFRIARGSLFETDAALDLVEDDGLILPAGMRDLLEETDRVLQALIRSMGGPDPPAHDR